MDSRRPLAADDLSPEEISALKELERRNRDRGARDYRDERYYGKDLFQLHAEALAYLHHLAPRAGERVLDAGAGVGRLARLIAPKVRRMVCVDLSAEVLEVLKSETDAMGIRNIETRQGDLCRLPSSLGPFDRAYSVEVLQHIPSDQERRAALTSIYEALKPGGCCLISVACWNARTRRAGIAKEGFWGTGDRRLYAYAFAPHEVMRLLTDTGFRDVRLHGLLTLPGRLTRHLPISLATVETWLSMVPVSVLASGFVIGMGRRAVPS